MSVEAVLTFMEMLAEREPQVLHGLLESGPEAVVAAAQERGVTLTLGDVIQGGAIMREAIQQVAENGELTEEALDEVAGGSAVLYGLCDVMDRMTHGPVNKAVASFVVNAATSGEKLLGKIFKGW